MLKTLSPLLSSSEGTVRNLPVRKSPAILYLGFLLLFLASFLLDQSTKLHAEKLFLVRESSSVASSGVHDHQAKSLKVFTLGVSPSLIRENSLAPETVSKNWLDFNLTYVRNPGAAWGSFGNLPEPYRLILFYVITIVAVTLILTLFRKSYAEQRLYRTALVFILAGAAGNFADRVLLNYVIDWLHFHWKIFGWEYSFPVFNVADVCINFGVGLMLLDIAVNELKLRSSKEKKLNGSATPQKFDAQS